MCQPYIESATTLSDTEHHQLSLLFIISIGVVSEEWLAPGHPPILEFASFI